MLGRLKVPNENVRIVFAATSTANVNSSSEGLTSWDEIKLPATVEDNTVTMRGDERPES